MTAPVDTPVVVVLFNRPDRVRELVAVLRQVRPSTVIAVADGPRPDQPGDVAACRDARAEIEAIDWPCAVEHVLAETNLGCDERIMTGLDRVFDEVERAVVLEDDIRPDPSFLPWAEQMLDRFGADPELALVSGYNALGASPDPAGHQWVRRGSIWGWGTTADAWRRVNAVELAGPEEQAAADIGALGLDPLVEQHYTLALEARRRAAGTAWDVGFALRALLLGAVCITSGINLIRNTGIGPGATRTTRAEDFNGSLTPVGRARFIADTGRGPIDPVYDRASLLLELLGRCVDPAMAARLGALAATGVPLPLEAGPAHHLAPFETPAESLRWLDHLVGLGLVSPHVDQLREALLGAVERSTP